MKITITIILAMLLSIGCKKKTENPKKAEECIEEKEEKKITYLEAKFYINNEQAQDQYYKIEEFKDTTQISERGIFLSNDKIIAKARILLIDMNYKEVEINFDNGNLKSDVLVKLVNDQYISYLNGKKVDSVKLDKTKALFEGPNPTFDFTNSYKVLKNTTSNSSTVVNINWVTGGLSTSTQEFSNKRDTMLVNKPSTSRLAKFYGRDLLSSTIKYYDYLYYKQNKEYFEFKKTVNIPDVFK